MNHILAQYAYLQMLDLISTIAFLAHGVDEANPVVRWFLEATSSPAGGLIAAKLMALALGLLAWKTGRRRLLARANMFFAVVVAWNLIMLTIEVVASA